MKWLINAWLVWCFTFSAAVGAAESSHPHPGVRQAVERFDEKTWPLLVAHGPRPAAYLFTTSYCSTCPDAFKTIWMAAQPSKVKTQLAVVLMDVEGEQALRHAHHFKGLNRLFAFDGYEPAIRHAIDPDWQDITPYIVLIDKNGKLSTSLGAPSAQALKTWLQ